MKFVAATAAPAATTAETTMDTPHAPSAVGQLRDWALLLAERGWAVFPLRPGTKRNPALHGAKSCPGTGICAAGHRGLGAACD